MRLTTTNKANHRDNSITKRKQLQQQKPIKCRSIQTTTKLKQSYAKINYKH